MSVALTPRNADLPTPGDWATMLSMAESLVASGMLPAHIKTPQAAVSIILRGRELGIPAMYALSNIVYIQGKTTTNSELMLALIYRDHGDQAVQFITTDGDRCQLAYKRRGWDGYRQFEWTLDDAKRAGLLSNATWQKYPAAMLRARAVSAVARLAFPDSISGMYTPEELGADVELDREGGFVIVEPPMEEPALAPRQLPGGDMVDTDGVVLSRETAIGDLVDSADTATDVEELRRIYRRGRGWGLQDEPLVVHAIERAKDRIALSTLPTEAQAAVS